MGGRGDGGGPRGARRRRQATQIWLVPTVDGIDRVIDGPLHHRQVDHGERRRLAEARESRYVGGLPIALTALMFQSRTGLAGSAAATDATGINPIAPSSVSTDKPASKRRARDRGHGSIHRRPSVPLWSGARPVHGGMFNARTCNDAGRGQIRSKFARNKGIRAGFRGDRSRGRCPKPDRFRRQGADSGPLDPVSGPKVRPRPG